MNGENMCGADILGAVAFTMVRTMLDSSFFHSDTNDKRLASEAGTGQRLRWFFRARKAARNGFRDGSLYNQRACVL